MRPPTPPEGCFARSVAGDKTIDTMPLWEVEPLTDYVRAGVTALACEKNYAEYLDETAQRFDVISISAGGQAWLASPARPG